MDRSHFEVVADVDQRHWWFLGRRRILRDVLAQVLPLDLATTVIDVGCGTGANIAALADSYRCIGIDTSHDAIEFAKQRFTNVEFICGRAPRDLGAAASAARGMLLMDVLEHLEDDRGVLAPLIESMQPGAVMLVTVPADMRLWSAHDEGLLHYRRYDEAMLRQTWRGLPVEPIAVTHFCSRLYPLARLQRSLGRARQRFFPASSSANGHEWDMRVPMAPLNGLLERTFAGESPALCDLACGKRRHGYSHGVSLMALLRRVDRGGASGGAG